MTLIHQNCWFDTNVAKLYTHSKLNMSENSISKSPEIIFKIDEMVKLSLDTKKFWYFLTSAFYLIMTANRHSVFHITCITYFIYVYEIWYCQCLSDIFTRIVYRLSNSWRSSFDRTSFMLTLLHNKFQNKKLLPIYSIIYLLIFIF